MVSLNEWFESLTDVELHEISYHNSDEGLAYAAELCLLQREQDALYELMKACRTDVPRQR